MIRIFVGCAANHDDAESMATLEHSVRSRTAAEVEFIWMRLSKSVTSPFFSNGIRGWQTKLWATPFSGFRWLVPALCNFSGKAIYCDSDVIALADIQELWDQEFQIGRVVMAKGGDESWRYCVSLWDCAAAKRHIPPAQNLMANPMSHKNLIAKFKNSANRLVQPFVGNWNCIDGEDYDDLTNPEIKMLHYSSEAHQPHLRYAVPRMKATGGRHWFDGEVKRHWREDVIALFEREYAAARAAGYDVERYTNESPFGDYVKASQKNYQSNKWGRAHVG